MIEDFIQNFEKEENEFVIHLDLNYLDTKNNLSPHFKFKLNNQRLSLSENTK